MSPCYTRLLRPDGLHALPYEAESLAEAARYEPEGVYTVANTYHTYQTLKLGAHLDRMAESARLEGFALKIDRARLKAALRQMIAEAGYGDVRFRITVPRHQPDDCILALEPFSPPPASLIESGIRCMTTGALQRRNPAAKTSDWLADRQTFQKPDGIYEVLLLAESGHILEGFSSNFYAVLDGELRTAGAGVLPGIAQQVVFEVTAGLIPVRREAVHTGDVPRLSEAFISSSSRGVIPVVQIDDVKIGEGVPGKQTGAIRQAYNAWVAAHLEDL